MLLGNAFFSAVLAIALLIENLLSSGEEAAYLIRNAFCDIKVEHTSFCISDYFTMREREPRDQLTRYLALLFAALPLKGICKSFTSHLSNQKDSQVVLAKPN
jgi:hypothetical protein